jgi:hypothetical protein
MTSTFRGEGSRRRGVFWGKEEIVNESGSEGVRGGIRIWKQAEF